MTDRIIGDLDSGKPGPTLVCVGGIHGSEPAGVRALERFFPKVQAAAGDFSGRFVAARGNLRALAVGRRYVDRDLNRIWDPGTVRKVASGEEPPDPAVDYEELRDLARLLHDTLDTARGPVTFIDLHSTSSECPPFFWLIPSPGIEEVLPRYGLPIVFDPMNRVTGTLCQYVATLGHQVIIVEGGRHDAPDSVDHLEAVLWITMEHLGCLSNGRGRDDIARARDLFRRSRGETPVFSDIVHHHKIIDGDAFRMRPGYRSFQPVRRGEHLADDRNGPIRAPMNGLILMPLYRPPCEDGFMIIRERGA